VFACLRLRFKDPSMRFTFILFIAFMAAVVGSGTVLEGRGGDRKEVAVSFRTVDVYCMRIRFCGAAQSVCRLVAA
jgi:hypothetical protein